MIWTLWKHRNLVVFNNANPDASYIFIQLKEMFGHGLGTFIPNLFSLIQIGISIPSSALVRWNSFSVTIYDAFAYLVLVQRRNVIQDLEVSYLDRTIIICYIMMALGECGVFVFIMLVMIERRMTYKQAGGFRYNGRTKVFCRLHP